MSTIDIYELTGQRALVSRGIARRLTSALRERLAQEPTGAEESLDLDFVGVEAASPSFFDELMAGLGEVTNGRSRIVKFLHPPASVPQTFQAIGRGRELRIEETTPGCLEVELPMLTESPH